MTGKAVDYLGAFVVGGFLSIVSQGIFMFYLTQGIIYPDAISLMLITMIFVSFVLTIFGQYEKLERIGGMGAMLPFSGLASAIIQFTSKSLDDKKPFFHAAKDGLNGSVKIFAVGIVFSILVAFLI